MIARIISEIQEYTRETAKQFDRTRQLVGKSVGLGQGMEQSLKQILGSSVTAMEMPREILHATREVSHRVDVGCLGEGFEGRRRPSFN